MKRIVLVLATVGLVAAGCAKSSEQTTVAQPSGPATMSLGSVQKTVEGNVVTIPVNLSGITLVKANGDTSGKTGHFHVFIDKTPPAVGATVAKEAGIVHTPSNPIKLYGMKVGTHTIRIVLGDGIHRRLPGPELQVTVDVKGPSVWGTAPATIAKGQPLTVQLHSAGFDVMPVSSSGAMMHESASPGASGMKQGHYHVLIDPASPPKAGDTLPAPEKDKVIHTGESSVTISGLAAGEHVIWIVGGSLSHVAFDPAVMDKLAVTVTP